MIVQRLCELATRQGFCEDPAFEPLEIAFAVVVGTEGRFLGLEDLRRDVEIPSGKGPPRTKKDKGATLQVPRSIGAPNVKGSARFFADTLSRVLPLDDEPKSASSRETFWRQMGEAAAATGDRALAAALRFHDSLTDETVAAIRAQVETFKPGPGARVTFRDHDSNDLFVERDPLRTWFREHFAACSGAAQAGGPVGVCQVSGRIEPLAETHATKIRLPGGMAAGVALVSNDKAAFESYGLDGAVNAGLGYPASDAYARALNALIAESLGEASGLRISSRFSLGGVHFLYWTRRPCELHWMSAVREASPEQVARLLAAPSEGRTISTADANDFYCLAVSPNAARAVVRDFLELPVASAVENVSAWFADLQIVDHTDSGARANFPLWLLAGATVRSSDDLSPNLVPLLIGAALRRRPLPLSVLADCLRRLRVESGAGRLAPARMALVKLVVNRASNPGEMPMTAELDENLSNGSRGYACGRLLAFLARSQSPKDYGTGAQILERFFGSASTAPRAVFPLLLRLNRHHLRKIRDEMPGFAFNLEEELEQRLAPFGGSSQSVPDFPASLSLIEQGRFALGFYHQRAAYRAASADRKAAAAAKSAATEEPAEA